MISEILAEIESLREIEMNNTITEDLDNIVQALTQLATLRQDIQVMTYPAFEVIELYSAINQLVIDFVEEGVTFSDHADVSHSLVTSLYLLNATEYFSVEHPLGGGAFQVRRWDKTNIAQLGDITKRQRCFSRSLNGPQRPNRTKCIKH